jgi:hypothetical protein
MRPSLKDLFAPIFRRLPYSHQPGETGAHLSIYQFNKNIELLLRVENGRIAPEKKSKKLARKVRRKVWREWYESIAFISRL